MNNPLDTTTTTTTRPRYKAPNTLQTASSQTQTQLLNHVRIAQLIHYRSHNQHRRSSWYRHFSVFRRELKKICLHLGLDLSSDLKEGASASASAYAPAPAPAPTLAPAPSYAADRKRAKKRAKRVRKRGDATPLQSVTRQVQNWIDGDLPLRWYRAFTSLAATPSFAPLSLTLLALLARICSLLGVTPHLSALAKQARKAALASPAEEDYSADGCNGPSGEVGSEPGGGKQAGGGSRQLLQLQQEQMMVDEQEREVGEEEAVEEDLGEVLDREALAAGLITVPSIPGSEMSTGSTARRNEMTSLQAKRSNIKHGYRTRHKA